MRSSDDGHSWSADVPIMGSTTGTCYTFPFAPDSGHPADTFNRPWLAVDRSTGFVYAASHNIVDHEMIVTESKNDGASFGTIYAVDTTYPSDARGQPPRRVQEMLTVVQHQQQPGQPQDLHDALFQRATGPLHYPQGGGHHLGQGVGVDRHGQFTQPRPIGEAGQQVGVLSSLGPSETTPDDPVQFNGRSSTGAPTRREFAPSPTTRTRHHTAR
jgi:hypothetical protein